MDAGHAPRPLWRVCTLLGVGWKALASACSGRVGSAGTADSTLQGTLLHGSLHLLVWACSLEAAESPLSAGVRSARPTIRARRFKPLFLKLRARDNPELDPPSTGIHTSSTRIATHWVRIPCKRPLNSHADDEVIAVWESAADAEMPALPDGGARFKFTAMIQEEHGRPIYNLQCNTCDLRHHELFATVGSNRVRDASCVACAPAACLRGLRGGANPSPRSNLLMGACGTDTPSFGPGGLMGVKQGLGVELKTTLSRNPLTLNPTPHAGPRLLQVGA